MGVVARRIKNMKRFACPILALSLMTSIAGIRPLYGKTSGVVTGRVSAKDGSAVLGAIISVFRRDRDGGTISFTRSDKNGFYRIANIAPGAYALQVTREGFQPLTNSDVKIAGGKATTLNVILQDVIDLISDDKDPRNWDLKSVMRSTSDRRMIFKDLPGPIDPGQLGADMPYFSRSATVNVASSSGLGGENYTVYPGSAQSGIASNFAFAEPVSEHGRMILSGQLSSGMDSYWRVRDTYQYRQPGRDMKFSVGYGRMGLSSASYTDPSRPAQFLTQDPAAHDSTVQTVAMGFAGKSKIMDTLSMEYGFDFSRVYYGPARNFFSPNFQLVVTPADTWLIRTSMLTRRVSDANSLYLPDGELLNLMEPTYIAKIGGDLQVSQFRHKELAVAKELPEDTSVELAVYEDSMDGPGTPFLVGTRDENGVQTNVSQLRQDQTSQRGVRIAVSRKLLEYLAGSVVYVYGSGARVSPVDSTLPADLIARDLLDFVHRSYYHSLTGEVHARMPRTNTNVAAAVRWYPGYSLTPIDLFADRMDILTKGVNFSIRQPIPLPEFMGTAGRWEALLDIRNLFDQGADPIKTATGDVLLIRNPRSLRFGINLNLY